nr:MAG TPA: hypothetical protein [Caudoviricetes sp.]
MILFIYIKMGSYSLGIFIHQVFTQVRIILQKEI